MTDLVSMLSLTWWVLLTCSAFPVYSMAPADLVDPLIYDGFVEELVEVLEIKETLLNVGLIDGWQEWTTGFDRPFSLCVCSCFICHLSLSLSPSAAAVYSMK